MKPGSLAGPHPATSACTSLDFVEAALYRHLYPMIGCHIDLVGNLSVSRLTRAIGLSGHIVPELLYACDFGKACFEDRGFGADDVFAAGEEAFGAGWHWDLQSGPQLAVRVAPSDEGCRVSVGMSHVLADGSGFKQYLGLLASLYNDQRLPAVLPQNYRKVPAFVRHARVGEATPGEKAVRGIRPASFDFGREGSDHFCLTSLIGAGELAAIKAKAKRCGATLNDAFIAAYARVAARATGAGSLWVPCPADLRNFAEMPPGLSVTNLSGTYDVPVAVLPGEGFGTTLENVHAETAYLKQRGRCFRGIAALDRMYGRMPLRLLGAIVRNRLVKIPISYTNLGIVDERALSFAGCTTRHCFMTGTYRKPPEFQLSVSTFKGACTLNCTLIGDEGRRSKGQQILDEVRSELTEWAAMG